MTRKRNDSHSTEFGLWLREQPEIASERGYVATNIDYLWQNYRTNQWLLLEEKRYGRRPARWQAGIFKMLNWCAEHHPHFCGFYVLIFEHTCPDDGRMWLNGKEVTTVELIELLQFKQHRTGAYDASEKEAGKE